MAAVSAPGDDPPEPPRGPVLKTHSEPSGGVSEFMDFNTAYDFFLLQNAQFNALALPPSDIDSLRARWNRLAQRQEYGGHTQKKIAVKIEGTSSLGGPVRSKDAMSRDHAREFFAGAVQWLRQTRLRQLNQAEAQTRRRREEEDAQLRNQRTRYEFLGDAPRPPNGSDGDDDDEPDNNDGVM